MRERKREREREVLYYLEPEEDRKITSKYLFPKYNLGVNSCITSGLIYLLDESSIEW
jgi:hypothetical protein